MEHHLVDLYSTSGTFKMLLTTPGFIEETIIKLHRAAVGNRIGTTSFNLHTNSGYNRGLSSILNYDYMNTDYKQISVPIVTLDQSIDSNLLSDVKVIKIDTQGYEYEVLQGAQQIIQASHPIVCFEYHNHPSHTLEDILNLLPNHYQLYRLYS